MSDAFDVAIIGGGLAGLIAANRAAELGLRTIVLEKGIEEKYPCNSRITSGVCHVASNSIELAPSELAAVIRTACGDHAREDLVTAVAEDARRAVDWLKNEGAKFVGLGVGYVNLRRHLVLAPPRRFREGLDWQGRSGDALLTTLERNLAKRGGVLRRGAAARRLLVQGGRCVGVLTETTAGHEEIQAAAVVVADGGFQASREMVARYLCPRPDRLLLRAAPSGDGSGVQMALDIGACVVGAGTFYGHLQAIEALQNDRLWPYPNMDVLATASIVVGPDGQRFTDEGRGAVPLTNAVAQLADPLSSVVIFDEAAWQGAGKENLVPPNPYLESAGGSRASAQDLAALAAGVGVDATALLETVERYNAAVHGGTLDRLDPPRTSARYKAWPIEQPPFHAVRLCAGLTNTMGGLAVDGEMRVLREDNSAIPGLFAAGSCTGGLEGGPRIAYVGGLVKAFVFGLRAAEAIARERSPT